MNVFFDPDGIGDRKDELGSQVIVVTLDMAKDFVTNCFKNALPLASVSVNGNNEMCRRFVTWLNREMIYGLMEGVKRYSSHYEVVSHTTPLEWFILDRQMLDSLHSKYSDPHCTLVFPKTFTSDEDIRDFVAQHYIVSIGRHDIHKPTVAANIMEDVRTILHGSQQLGLSAKILLNGLKNIKGASHYLGDEIATVKQNLDLLAMSDQSLECVATLINRKLFALVENEDLVKLQQLYESQNNDIKKLKRDIDVLQIKLQEEKENAASRQQ